ncbi:MAG: GNAT family N-acetyltransferase [Fusobacteriaceae bacterium]
MIFKEVKSNDTEILKNLKLIEEEVFGENGGADSWLLKTFTRYGLLYIIIDNDEIVAAAEFIQILGKKELFLYGFLTREKYRNMGYAKKLIEFSEKKIKSLGYSTILLTVDPENLIGVNLYKNKGYEIIEFQKNEYGPNIDRLLMKKILI